jgi:hypothetical protein
MNTSPCRVDGCRVAALVALGLEFAHSHGLAYACDLIDEMGADERTVALLIEQAAVALPASHPPR